ncbi:MAG: nucleotide exchange factor GrpE [Verrucomicrobiaceae bacterium]|nr:nucleotide exchange factor GrpE [Verrucomicrobiaceae bacterium]
MTNTQNDGNPDPVESTAGEGVIEEEMNEDAVAEADEAPQSEAPVDPTAELDKWKDVAARAQADLDNFRKRMAREKSEAIQYANRDLLEQILPIIDNFEMGLKAAGAAEGESSMILQGMSMVYKQIEDFLSDQGVERIESDGVAFDPNVHDALKQESHATVPEGHIIYTIRRGYRLKERILRAANVVVSSGAEEPS